MATLPEDLYHYLNHTVSVGADPTIDSWFLFGNPKTVSCILAAYLLFVLKLGPEYMKNRKPFDLKKLVLVYNFYQVLFSIWLCIAIYRLDGGLLGYVFNKKCQFSFRDDPEHLMRGYELGWFYNVSRIIDLLDTVFFTLRKKQNQVTFLHVVHHFLTVSLSWCYVKYCPEEQGQVIGFMNSFVHIFMYLYYLLAAMGPQLQPYLWWKKYLTTLQLFQFCVMLSYTAYITLADCELSFKLTIMFVTQASLYLFLFGQFYKKSYTKKIK